ncbi:hypothetical protein ACHHYP_07073 [Achlya hypogyna]|uniref:DDE Tnp4 domain-containing protein n=1 Tax=Achlya hypogyna TaxID=1202772 RepID=A0A1V9ZMV1_ACHHY|nr:hypothetical protein ACHHYP_07073 [Achlya hypogyna]
MLATSRILVEFQKDNVLRNYCVYGDPAYGCYAGLSCPNSNAQPGFQSPTPSFGLVKSVWGYINHDKKVKLRQYPLVAVLLTNCHTYLKPTGNQISKYFGVNPPSMTTYLPLA